MRVTTAPPAAMAAAGAVCISSSAVLMALAATSASITALGRCAFALPVLGALTLIERRRGAQPMPPRGRWLARLAGVFLAGDLVSVEPRHRRDRRRPRHRGDQSVGPDHLTARLARPRRAAAPLAGARLPGDAGRPGAGRRARRARRVAGVRQRPGAWRRGRGGCRVPLCDLHPDAAAGRLAPRHGRAAGSRWPTRCCEATLGATAGSAALGFALHDFHLGHAWPTLGWLALLAITSQVIGWLLITVSMPRLPAGMIGALLLVQPAGSVGAQLPGPRRTALRLQLFGVALCWPACSSRWAAARVAPHRPPRIAATGGRTRIIRQASAASTAASAAEVAVAGHDGEPARQPDARRPTRSRSRTCSALRR